MCAARVRASARMMLAAMMLARRVSTWQMSAPPPPLPAQVVSTPARRVRARSPRAALFPPLQYGLRVALQRRRSISKVQTKSYRPGPDKLQYSSSPPDSRPWHWIVDSQSHQSDQARGESDRSGPWLSCDLSSHQRTERGTGVRADCRSPGWPARCSAPRRGAHHPHDR